MKTYQIDGYTVRVNTTDYECVVVVEDVRAQNVPAWEERNLGDLAGPFASREAAEMVCAELERIYG
jgi:hypothetical protein